MAIPIPRNMIGGARVTRTFNFGGKQMRMGEMLSGEEVRTIRQMNLTSLVDRGHLHVWPKDQESNRPIGDAVRYPIAKGFGRYDVIEGRKLNTEPLSREEAYKLASVPMPEGNGNGKDH